MNGRRLMLAMAAATLVAGACGGGGDAVSYSPEDLGAVLLSADDVGSGWSEERRAVFEARPEDMPVFDPGMWCPAAGDVADELVALVDEGGALVEVRAPEAAGRNFHGVTEQLWSGSDSEALLERATTAFEACIGATWEVDEDATATVASLAVADVGDESTAVLVTYLTPSPDGDYAWRGRTLVARFGATVLVLNELDVQTVESEPRFSDADWRRLVDTAAERIEALDR